MIFIPADKINLISSIPLLPNINKGNYVQDATVSVNTGGGGGGTAGAPARHGGEVID